MKCFSLSIEYWCMWHVLFCFAKYQLSSVQVSYFHILWKIKILSIRTICLWYKCHVNDKCWSVKCESEFVWLLIANGWTMLLLDSGIEPRNIITWTEYANLKAISNIINRYKELVVSMAIYNVNNGKLVPFF